MLVIDELYHHTALQISSSDLLYLIQQLKVKKENEIETLKHKIEQFEQKNVRKKSHINQCRLYANGSQGDPHPITKRWNIWFR